MTSLTLNLSKPGDTPKKLQLNLKKGESFTVQLGWEGSYDLDLHSMICINDGSGGKVQAFEDLLSTYNVIRQVKIDGVMQTVGTLPKNPDGTFQIRNGALIHSPDATDGIKEEIDEFIKVDPTKISVSPGTMVEIPIIAMIHPQSSGKKFADVQNANVKILNADGVSILNAQLSNQFGSFVGVQLGSITINESGVSDFVQVGVGFNGDFNDVLGHFS